MSETQNALDAILADPSAELLRYHYADAITTTDPERAEFIRLQLDIDRLSYGDDRWPAMARRERELLVQHADAWTKPFRDAMRPSILQPGRWLKATLFGQGGRWKFHAGFVEEIDTSAVGFLTEDGFLFGKTPIRRVVLSNVSSVLEPIIADTRLDRLLSLHLVSDPELDDDMETLRGAALAAGLTVVELRYPRMVAEEADLFAFLRGPDDAPLSPRLEQFMRWQRATEVERGRLRQIAKSARIVQRISESEDASHAETLRINDWISFGDSLTEAGVWAVAKSYHDLESDDGSCRRLALIKPKTLRPDGLELLKLSPHFVGISTQS